MPYHWVELVFTCFYTRSVITPRGSVDMKGSRLVVRHKAQTPFCKGLLCNPNFLLLCGNCVTSVVWQKCCSQFMNPISPTAELYQGLLPGDHYISIRAALNHCLVVLAVVLGHNPTTL